MRRFTHLHLHTDASPRDGLGTVARTVGRAKALGFDKLAITDHGTLANAVAFTAECQMQGLKPIMGLEGYLHFDGEVGHITLLADGARGWESLVRLNNLAHAGKLYKSPAFSIDELIEHQDGLVCLTGCIASPFHRYGQDDAAKLGARLKEAFGTRLFAEVMLMADTDTWSRPLWLAHELGIKPVLTNDVHFAYKEDAVLHPILTRMKAGYEYNSGELWLKTPEELAKRAAAHGLPAGLAERMMSLAGAIGDKLGAVELRRDPVLPGESEYGNAELRKAVFHSDRYESLSVDPKYKERIFYELNIIARMDYPTYFLILNDIISHAREGGVRIGPGRGSGAGSLVLYVLGVTDVDPIKYGLQFERFLNPERRGMPDVDVDFESEKRDRVIEYASEKYGAHPIATYARYSHKTLVHDLAKMFGVPKEAGDEAADGGPDSEPFRRIVDEHPRLGECYDAFIGQIRHKGKHAGGVIITDVLVPIERTGDTLAASWTEGKSNELSFAGIVKFDLLGLSALSVLRRLETKFGIKAREPVKHSPVFDIFKTGDLSGIFQFSGSTGIRNLTMRLAPEDFSDLVAINAVYRPGAIDAGSAEMFPEWKKSPRRVPRYIRDILEETYGAIVYQEQFMEIFRRTVSGTLGQADIARRIIVKSKPDDPKWDASFEGLRLAFVEGAIVHGLSEAGAEKLWHELSTHSRYSFNKSHSTAYSMIAWEMAWWKFFHPAEFFAEMLNVDPANAQSYIFDAVARGIPVEMPHANRAATEWSVHDERIYLPLGALKFMGTAGADAVVASRAADGDFRSMEDFMARVPKKLCRGKGREGMLALGAFDGMEVSEKKPKVFVLADASESDIENAKKVLGTKKFSRPATRRDAQMDYLGFVVPTAKMLKAFDDYRSRGAVAGIVSGHKDKESRYGPYRVYFLAPHGVFWSRDMRDIQEGTAVAAKVNSSNGKGERIEIIMGGV